MKSRLVCLVTALCTELLPLAATAQDITIQGKTFYKDGKPWILKGVHVGAFDRPKFIPSAPKWRNDSSAQVRNLWGPDELNAVKRVFGADTI